MSEPQKKPVSLFVAENCSCIDCRDNEAGCHCDCSLPEDEMCFGCWMARKIELDAKEQIDAARGLA